MCGIFGCYDSASVLNSESFDLRLRSAQEHLYHRGPDDQGIEKFLVGSCSGISAGVLALGHTRLSIIDLSPGGHQPMHSADGRYSIVFNGEIYNYRELRDELITLGHSFHTDSDTEVLLAAWSRWGISALSRFVGMFAFAVYDRQVETLTLIRDAFGIKPLFYKIDNNSISFASESTALLSLLDKQPSFNIQQAYDYLVFGKYDTKASTFYDGVFQLKPGHVHTTDLKSLKSSVQKRWWNPSIEERTDLIFEEAVSIFRKIFLSNIRLHLRSDVSVGAALSGGLDSSAVVCAMRYLEPDMPIHTFSYIARNTVADEEYWVDIVNKHVGAIPHKVFVEPHQIIDDLDALIDLQGEPFLSTSIYAQYRVYSLAQDVGITVTLDGQGADELLAGYNGYPSYVIKSLLDKNQFFRVIRFLNCWSRWPGRGRLRAFKALLQALLPSNITHFVERFIVWLDVHTWLNIDYLIGEGVVLTPTPSERLAGDVRGRRLVAALREALTSNGLPSLLRHGDRNSMRCSIESRVPFLTIELAEFLLSLPESYLLGPDGETKRIFRAAMRGIVPDEILDRRDKIGFQTPEHSWLSAQTQLLDDTVSASKNIPYIYSHNFRSYLHKILFGNKLVRRRIWPLINYIRWLKLH